MKNADLRVVRRIEAMTTQEQEELIVRLTDYATWLIRQKTRWLDRPGLPKGYDAGALAVEAITRVLDGTRQWDPDQEPDLLRYLRSVVRSILWDLQKAAEKENLTEVSMMVDGDPMDAFPTASPGPDEEMEAEELKERMLAELDEDEDRLVLLSIFEGGGGAGEIAAELGLAVEDVYRIKRKIKRRFVGLAGGE